MKPVKAWAIVRKPGYYTKVPRVYRTREECILERHSGEWECLCCGGIVRVEIREVKKAGRRKR